MFALTDFMSNYPELVSVVWAGVERLDANDRRIVADELRQTLRGYQQGSASHLVPENIMAEIESVCQALNLMADSRPPFVPARMNDYRR